MNIQEKMHTGTPAEVMDRMLALGILENPSGDLLNLSEKFKAQTALNAVELHLTGKYKSEDEIFEHAQMLTIAQIAEIITVNQVTDFMNIIATWVKKN